MRATQLTSAFYSQDWINPNTIAAGVISPGWPAFVGHDNYAARYSFRRNSTELSHPSRLAISTVATP